MRALLVAGGLVTLTILVLSAKSRSVVKGRPRSPKATPAMHAAAKQLATDAFTDVVHAPPTENERRVLEAVALHETTFGAGWKDEGAGSHNMGAIQANASWTGATFGGRDSHPTDTGGAVWYSQAFRKYPSALEGWKDLVRELYVNRPSVRNAARSGDVMAVAKAMRATRYYEGQGATQEQRIRGYAQALADSLLEIDGLG